MRKIFGRCREGNKAAGRGNQAWQDWCEAVLTQVRFQPDHRAIQRELLDHLEDGCADLERLGYERTLAEQRTLDAMGEAKEIGAALDRAHHPFWGWLWRFTRILMLALAVTAAVTLCFAEGFSNVTRMTRNELRWEAPPALTEKIELEHGTLYAAPGEVWEEDGHVKAEILMWIEMRDPFLAGAGPRTWHFTYRDSQGELVFCQMGEDGSWPESRYWQYGYLGKETGWTRFRQTVELTLDECPEWVEISYPSGGGWTLRVDWRDAA